MGFSFFESMTSLLYSLLFVFHCDDDDNSNNNVIFMIPITERWSPTNHFYQRKISTKTEIAGYTMSHCESYNQES